MTYFWFEKENSWNIINDIKYQMLLQINKFYTSSNKHISTNILLEISEKTKSCW